jgi:hypothetical protein
VKKRTAYTSTMKWKLELTSVLIFFIWAFINIFLCTKNGMVTSGEAEKYIGQAKVFLQTGNLSSPNLWFYFIEIGLIATCLKLHCSLVLVVGMHLLFNFIATIYFYKIIGTIFNSRLIAMTGTLMLLFNLPYQEFNSFLQTESLFYSFTLILSCYMLTLHELSAKKLITVIFLLSLIATTRPTGLLFLPPAFLYLFFIHFKKTGILKKTGLFFTFSVVFLFVINKAMASGGEFDFMMPFKDEDIICGYATLAHTAAITMPGNGNSLSGLVFYIIHNFGQFIRLAGLKTIAFFGLYRSYYSPFHNAYLMIYFYSVHIMVIASLSFWIKNHFHRLIYLLSIIIITLLTVILTCDDWHNRFYLSISPYLILIGMGMVKGLIKNKGRKQTSLYL